MDLMDSWLGASSGRSAGWPHHQSITPWHTHHYPPPPPSPPLTPSPPSLSSGHNHLLFNEDQHEQPMAGCPAEGYIFVKSFNLSKAQADCFTLSLSLWWRGSLGSFTINGHDIKGRLHAPNPPRSPPPPPAPPLPRSPPRAPPPSPLPSPPPAEPPSPRRPPSYPYWLMPDSPPRMPPHPFAPPSPPAPPPVPSPPLAPAPAAPCGDVVVNAMGFAGTVKLDGLDVGVPASTRRCIDPGTCALTGR